MDKQTTDDIVSFGYWVQQRRLALKLTRPALARQVNCSPSTIKKIERDERRPSRQIAGLLADHLLIPGHERVRFIDMARGVFVATPLSTPDSIPPSFLWPSVSPVEPAPLVARESEMERLAAQLDEARTGKGGILFITGEAGDGKTVLAQAFVRHILEQHADLVVATGNCNAYTGVGDPYLPFREILELLTGDIQTHWDAGVMRRAYAERLWALVPDSVQALLDAGPDLVDTFLLGVPLLDRAAAAIPRQDSPLLEQLQSLTTRHRRRRGATFVHQSNLFAQYTRVLHRLAQRRSLLLIIDDLQWADVGSISLLFHLSRHLAGQRILLVGIFRAAEVALGRDGERHPLEPLLNELQGNFGDIFIRLNQANGRRFVDQLVDSEPNWLDQLFRDALYRQTGGHPLFTVEMLHALQERGDVIRNREGEWIESPQLDWHIVPARIEGVIKERVERLPLPLQTFLRVASVAGESFYAEIIAHVHGVDEQRIAGQLEMAPEREQRLVNLQGRQQVGETHLSLYSFRHILFQHYLYNSLNANQRAYLHRAIAEEMEKRFVGEEHLIAPQLARHYAIAGDERRALHHSATAGEMAAAVYAHAEAETHYRHAIRLAHGLRNGSEPPAEKQRLGPLYQQLGRTLELSSRQDRAIAVYEEMERVGQEVGDAALVLASLLARATLRTTVNFARNPAEGRVLLERAQSIALELDDQPAQARILWTLLIMNAYTGDDPYTRLRHGEEALELARRLGLQEQLAFILHDIFYAYAGMGRWQKAREALYEARDLWQQLGNLPMLAEAHMRLHWVFLVTGDYEQAITLADEAYRLGVESHNAEAQALSHFMLGFVHWERGQIEQALGVMEEDIALAETVNSLTPLIGTRADLGMLYGELGDVERGLALAEAARATAEGQLPILRFWPHAVQVSLHLRQGNPAEAQQMLEALADYQTVKERFGYMPFMWIRVGLAHGEFGLQQQAFDEVVDLMDALYTELCEAGIWHLRPDVLHLKGRALIGCGQFDDARDALLEARAAAEQIGSLRALWPVLVSLAEIARRRGDDTTALSTFQEAGAIVTDIADHIATPGLRAAFLASTAVNVLQDGMPSTHRGH